ncbi:MAG: bifunctional UDP-sugar hydrolase/5'-nucleotidase [Clostridium sp.]|uniref:bifunctional metallophosphatase/5'-nucleotidase n=1 Tax=Clostridium sp. TaxID=1506 RepID=UPI00303AE217
MKIRILHTNDVHSRFENFAKIVSKINELRDENTLVLDAGDFNDFMRIELQGTKGQAGGRLLEKGGYDAITVGNNEGFAGIELLEEMINSTSVPFLSCNLYKHGNENIKGIKRSIIISKGGIRFLIFGITPVYNEFFELSNLHASDQKEEIEKELEANRGKYDISILLSHAGMREDRDFSETMEGVDIIINGHSHILMESAEKTNNTIIHQSGCYGTHLGVLDIEFEGYEIKSFIGENIDIENMGFDENIITQLNIEKELAVKNLSVPLYEVDRNIWHDIVEENPITNLLADGLRDVIDCDFSIINSGIINGGIKKGHVSMKKLLEISPSPLNPTYMEIEGKYIKEALKESLKAEVCMMSGSGSGFRGKYLGRLHVSGAIIEHNGKDIIRIILGDGELEDDRIYRVSTSDYLQRGTGYSSLANNKNERYNPEYTRDTLKEYLSKREFVEMCFEDRWIKI